MLNNCKISGFADEIGKDLMAQISLLTRLGQHYIEFRSANGKGVADYSLEEAKEVKEILSKHGIQLSSLGSPIGKLKMNEDFAAHFEKFKHIVELTKVFGCRYIRMFSFYMPEDEDPSLYRDEVLRRLGQMTAYAKEQDVVLLHENEKGIYGDNAARCLDLMENLYCDHFKCVFDFANFVQCKQDTWEAYEMLKPYIAYVHVKDALMADGTVVPPGNGDGQLTKIFKTLDEAGYQGFLSLEPHLADFVGLKDLEQDVKERGTSDTAAAYELAFTSLQGLLK